MMMFKQTSARQKVVSAAIMGNFIESFDLNIQVFFAAMISSALLPSADNVTQLQNFFLIFFATLFARPIGSLLFGLLGDTFGRKKVLYISVIMMGLTSLSVAFIPNYSSIGVKATVIYILLRVLQSLSFSGEFTNSTVYLTEHSETKKRGFFGSFAVFGWNLGALAAVMCYLLMAYCLTTEELRAWGWRIPILLALPGMIIGFYIRKSCAETLPFIESDAYEPENAIYKRLNDFITYIKSNIKQCLCLMALVWFGVAATYTLFIYAPTHMGTFSHIDYNNAMQINLLSYSLLIILVPIFGRLSDNYNRIRLLKYSTAFVALFAIPYLYLISYASLTTILLAHSLMTAFSACYFSQCTVLIVESFPTNIRCTTSGFIYAIPATLLGSATPFIAISLVKYFHNPVLPGVYLAGCGIVGLASLWGLGRKEIPENKSVHLSEYLSHTSK